WAMDQGVMPYRDSFEFNTPGVVLWHWVLGRAVGLTDGAFIAVTVAASGLSLVAAALWLKRRVATSALAAGLSVGLLAFVSITPWDRGQRELWQGLFFALAMLTGGAAVGRPRATGLGLATLAGLLAGAAVSFKWPYLLVVWPVWFTWLWLSAKQRLPGAIGPAGLGLGSFTGFSLATAGWVLWLAGNDALSAFAGIQALVIPLHAGQWSLGPVELLAGRWPLGLLALIVLGLVAATRRPRDAAPSDQGAATLMLTLAVIGSLLLYLVQRKGWTYHLHGAVPLLAPLAALTWERLAPRPVPSAALAVAAVTALYGASLVRYDLGPGLTRAHEVGGHWNHDAMTAAAAIIAASPPSDTVLTNDDELQLLLLAGRKAATPFIYGFLASESHPSPEIRRLAVQRVDAMHRHPPGWVAWNTTPYRPELDALDANPTLASLIRTSCRELLESPAPYRLFRCTGLGSEPSLDGGTLRAAELE
ncbi:MAG: hypothetical protein IV100_16230, partial [Myxococcales bacterium]|nr:hypothetical protein [Myxococcales bacterium]